MSLFDKSRARAAAFISTVPLSGAEADEARQEGHLRLMRSTGGPALFRLVFEAAEEQSRKTGVPLRFNSLELRTRILAISRVVANDPNDAEFITGRVMRRLLSRHRDAYLLTMLRGISGKIRIGKAREQKRDAGIEPDTLAAPQHEESVFADPNALRALVQSVVPKLRPEVLGVYVARQHADFTPEAIVAFFAGVTAPQLCANLRATECPRMSADDCALFREPLENSAAAADRRKLRHRWDPVRRVTGWTLCPDGSWGKTEDHCRLAWIAVNKQGLSVEEFIAGKSRMTMAELAKELNQELHDGTDKAGRMGDHYDPRVMVSYWIGSVIERMKYQVWTQSRDGIRQILKLPIERHKVLLFLCCHCFGMKVGDVLKDYGDKRLTTLHLALNNAYRRKFASARRKTERNEMPEAAKRRQGGQKKEQTKAEHRAEDLFLHFRMSLENDERTLYGVAGTEPRNAIQTWVAETRLEVNNLVASFPPFFAYWYRNLR